MSLSQSTPQERYHYKPFFGSSHTWAINIVRRLSPQSKLLDVGIGDGMLARTLKSDGFSNLWGIDIDPRAREACADVYQGTAASFSELKGQTFDVALLLDVLEHLQDPFTFFAEAASLIRPGGKILVSVPNVAHWSLRLSLLFGRWEYTERGLLDKTHLHFFTRAHFHELLTAVPGMQILSSGGSISPAEFVLPRWAWQNPLFKFGSRVRWLGAQSFPALCAFQHLALLEKRA
jgi:2-polyprenyl-3-methyl-5-hydroxy-6-metoxy-1,4-benzoquinol methylase